MAEKETDNVKLAVLEEKVFNMVEVISKLDDTIDKLSDLSVNVSKMLAVHEEKLEFARESAAETAKDMDDLEARFEEQLEHNADRIRSLERRVWVGLGIFIAVTVLLQSEFLMGRFFERTPDQSNQQGAIMERKTTP